MKKLVADRKKIDNGSVSNGHHLIPLYTDRVAIIELSLITENNDIVSFINVFVDIDGG